MAIIMNNQSYPAGSSPARPVRGGPSADDFPQHSQAPYPPQFNSLPHYDPTHPGIDPFNHSTGYPNSFAPRSQEPASPFNGTLESSGRYDYGHSYRPAPGPSRRRDSMSDLYGAGAYPTRSLAPGQMTEPRMGNHLALPGVLQAGTAPDTESALESWRNMSAQSDARPLGQDDGHMGGLTLAPGPGGRSRRSTVSKGTTDDEAGTGIGASMGPTVTGMEAQSDTDMSRPSTADYGNGKGKGSGFGILADDGPDDKTTILKHDTADLVAEDEKMDHRKRKRNRTIRSCVPCHNHKRKCDRKRPCGRCTALGLTGTCVYEVDEIRDSRDPNEMESDRLRRRVAELEKVVRELRQRQPARPSAPPSATSAMVDQEGDRGQDSYKKRRVIVDRFARFKMHEAAMAEVAAAAGAASGAGTKDDDAENSAMNWADGDNKTGPDKRDYRTEPYQTHLLPGEEMVHDNTGRKVFLGAPAGKSMLRRLRELMIAKSQGASSPRGGSASGSGDDDLLIIPEDAAFTGWFPDTRKTFPFTTIWSHENFSGEIIGLLPNKDQAELLLESWRDEVGAFFLAWHVPTLEAEYRRFFSMSTAEKMGVPLCCLALYLMICSLGCVMRASKSEIFGHPNRDVAKQAQVAGVSLVKDPKDLTCSRLQSELYLSAAYQALRLCSFLSNPTIYTIQAQILINIYLLNSERAADGWAQTGSLVRQCIAMGLHVDPTSLDPKISMRDAEVRRRIWWSVAGLDALFCVSFGRPSVINFYTTNLPQDRTDDNLSDAPGSAMAPLPPSNVLRNETTDMTYHAAYFQLTIPSFEMLDRIFRVDWKYSRSAIYGWFSKSPQTGEAPAPLEDNTHTYEDAISLAKDVFSWYAHLPRGMRFEPDEDTPESLLRSRSTLRINQTFGLCMKTFMIVLILHRPYLRVDPSAYPESAEICFKAAHTLLLAYTIGSQAKASIYWSWWTMSFRAFHAGAVVSFLAIRQPGTELARKCLADLRGTIAIFEDRITSWNHAHPVQADLCNGLVKLDKLATAAVQQRLSPRSPSVDSLSTASRATPKVASEPLHNTSPENKAQTGTPLSQIKGFPGLASTSPVGGSAGYPFANGDNHPQHPKVDWSQNQVAYQAAQQDGTMFQGDGFNGPESFALPHIWASMFGIKMDRDGQYNQGSVGG